ncbi:MAG: rRNA maturation RNase YbeY [Chloroflexota bacterium]
MIYLQIDDPLAGLPPADLPDKPTLLRAAQAALQTAGAGLAGEATLVLSDDARLQELNRQFLDIDAPTDVLSFPDGEVDPDTNAVYLGDIIISLPRAAAQAAAGGHGLLDELQLLVVHGMLHLLGHDHAEEDEKARMWALQAQTLERLGVSLRP